MTGNSHSNQYVCKIDKGHELTTLIYGDNQAMILYDYVKNWILKTLTNYDYGEKMMLELHLVSMFSFNVMKLKLMHWPMTMLPDATFSAWISQGHISETQKHLIDHINQ